MDQHTAAVQQCSGVAVRITDGQGSDHAFSLSDKLPPVADGRSGGDGLQVDDLTLHRHDWLDLHRLVVVYAGRIAAPDDRARTDGLVEYLRQTEDGRAVGRRAQRDRDAGLRQLLIEPVEALFLQIGIRQIFQICR